MRGIRAKLLVRYFAVLLVVLGTTGVVVTTRLDSYFMSGLRRDLLHRATIIAEGLPVSPEHAGVLDEYAERMSTAAGCRVTVVALDGTVAGESHVESTTMEDHSDRPEITGALTFGSGWEVRPSTTTGYPMMYAAVAAGGGVVRTSMPMNQIKAELHRIRVILATGAALSLAAAAVLGLIMGRDIVTALRDLASFAQRLAWGDYDSTARLRTNDELEEVAEALNQMAQSVRHHVRALSRQRDEQRVILDHLADGVIMFNSQGIVLHANRRACDLVGLHEPIGGGPEAVGRNPQVLAFIRRALNDREEHSALVHALYPEARTLQAHAARIPGTDSDLLLTLQDVTELTRLTSLRQELVTNISHELKTPVGAIRVLAETLEHAALEDPTRARDFTSRIVTEADRLTRMINEMLLLAKIEAGQITITQDNVDLAQLTRTTVEELAVVASERNIRLETEILAQASVIGDPVMLGLAISNLLTNAIKFSPPDTQVITRVSRANGMATVEVIDFGVGIPADQVPKVFERFYKADPSRQTPGAGLGLAIVKHTVLLHRGEVFGRSRLRHGSVFGFRIPSGPDPGPCYSD